MDELFKPRRTEERLSKLSPLQRRMIIEFTKDKEIEVYINCFGFNVKGLILEEPSNLEIEEIKEIKENKRTWLLLARLFIKKNYVEENEYYGTYDVWCNWDKKNERWKINSLDSGVWHKLKTKQYTKYASGKYEDWRRF